VLSGQSAFNLGESGVVSQGKYRRGILSHFTGKYAAGIRFGTAAGLSDLVEKVSGNER
jgi:hypothetical protein